ncbi:MAG: NAD-dependent epimerase/dehydratase family protein [Spirochaetales bacterium]|nr:MAG: NAD-dependent epimerase/dehydratase family protein [Spirochaetales bacterium]
MNVAVTGGTGFIGGHVLKRLVADGHRVTCLVLPGFPYEGVPGVTYHQGDLRKTDTLAGFLEGVQTIVHLAGLTKARTEREYFEVNADAVVRLLDAAAELSPSFSHVVAMSSLAAVGPTSDSRGICEDTPLNPISPYGRSKARLEAVLKDREDRTQWTVIRAPGVYGPHDRDFLQYFKLIKKGWRFVIGKKNLMSLVYVKNLADAIATCVILPAARNQVFFVADQGTYDWDDIGAMIEDCFQQRTRRVQVPYWAIHVVSLLSDLVSPFMREAPLLNRHKLAEMSQKNWVVSHEKVYTMLGYEPSTRTKDALRETGEWYLANGWI